MTLSPRTLFLAPVWFITDRLIYRKVREFTRNNAVDSRSFQAAILIILYKLWSYHILIVLTYLKHRYDSISHEVCSVVTNSKIKYGVVFLFAYGFLCFSFFIISFIFDALISLTISRVCFILSARWTDLCLWPPPKGRDCCLSSAVDTVFLRGVHDDQPLTTTSDVWRIWNKWIYFGKGASGHKATYR